MDAENVPFYQSTLHVLHSFQTFLAGPWRLDD